MAVSTGNNKSDISGKTIDALISTRQTTVSGLSPTGVSAPLYDIQARALLAEQTAAVIYYMSIGRINPATVLSTLS